MNRKAFQTCAATVATALGLLMAGRAGAQSPPTAFPGDWPGNGSYNNRLNQNSNPLANTSGNTRLRWLTPSTTAERLTLLLDNTSFVDTTGFVGGPYDPPATGTGFVNGPFPNAAAWPGPTDVAKEANEPYLMPRHSAAGTVNRLPRVPSYNYATCTPMARDQADPTVAQTPAQRKYFEWIFTPPAGAERNYALYAWLPIGPTDVSPNAVPDRRFTQRYFVYEIRYGFDRNADGVGDGRFIDVVDTEASGNGFVRLGNGGLPTQNTFPFTGGQPIRVRLYNIVPRASTGILQLSDAKLGDSDATETTMSNKVLVYADAAEAQPQPGTIIANPVAATVSGAGNAIDWNLTIARNVYTPGLLNGDGLQSVNGIVTSYQANPLRWPLTALTTPLVKWRYSLVQESSNGNTIDNPSADVTFTGGWTTSTVNGNRVGANYRITPVVISPAAATQTATYAPNLDDGNYDLYAYVGGNVATEQYARGLRYQIFEGTRLAFTGSLDEANQKGWIRLGTRRYVQVRTDAQLRVVYYNVSTNTGDAGRRAFADAIRFVGAANLGVTSTPVHATVAITPQGGGTPVDKKVVIVADESGKIHCLDMVGNADGTTTEYWSYPSTPNPSNPNWADPNLVAGIDGTINPAIQPPSNNEPTALMPTSFDLSSAAVARVNVGGGVIKDLLYIGATNGRVYCIDMAGRGDFVATSHIVGSTSRRWSYPDDFPTSPAKPSDLGAFQGSLVYGDTAQGAVGPTIYVPSVQGRLLALNAIGTEASASGGGITTVRWQYPLEAHPTLPPIQMTPTLQFNHLYFGTLRDPNDGGPGQFYSLRADTGVLEWRINGTQVDDTIGTTVIRTDDTLGSFITAPVGVTGANLAAVASPYTTTNVDTLYVLNQNLNLYGLDPLTGAVITNGGRSYVTSDVNQLSGGHLTYTVTKAFDRLGVKRLFPMISIAGDDDGHFRLAFARLEDYNIFEGYLGDGLNFPAGIRSMAAANNFMFTGDKNGSVYALDDLGAAGGNLPPNTPFDPGISEIIPPNDPRGKPFRKLRIKLVTKAGYVQLRDSNADGTGKLTYDQAITQGLYDAPNPSAGNPFAFEWGQTAYILVYDFPYADKNEATPPADVPPPQINISLSVEGKTVRNVQVDSRKFTGTSPAMDPADDPNGVGYRKDGYAIVPFSFQNAGVNTLPPGPGLISATISTAAIGTSGQQVEITQDTRSTSASRVPFIMANPLALFIPASVISGSLDQGIAYFGDGLTNPYNAANAINGSPDVAGTSAIESQLLASAGLGQHGGTQTSRVYIVDRSLMALLRQDGIANLRVTRTNLQRQGRGQVASIYRALAPGNYPGFEDSPSTYPNRSLDYPDIGREQVRAIKDPNGTAENPLLTTVSLKTPLSIGNAPLTEDNLGTNNDRRPQLTPVDMLVDIPRYQPPVNLSSSIFDPLAGPDVSGDFLRRRRDANGAQPPQGYFGRVWAFVDSTGDGKLNNDVNEANRAFNFSVGVLPQTSIQVGTPTVDLGSLAAGTGYAPANPAAVPGGPYNPWFGTLKSLYKPISVRNDGNVNLVDLRMVKGYNEDNGFGTAPWPLRTADNDPLAWLSGALLDNTNTLVPGDLWSNIDTTFAAPNLKGPSTGNRVILPKPRITDRVPSELVANPFPRANPNLGTNGSSDPANRLNPSLDTTTPSVGISVPIGFPVGSYSSQIRVVEDEYDYRVAGDRTVFSDNQVLDFFNTSRGYEAYSDPITLTFKVRESRMTNNNTPGTAPMIDDLNLLPTDGSGKKVAYRNAAPAAMRDAYGSLVVAYESDWNRGSGTPVPSLAASASRIYLSSLRNGADFASGNSTNAPAGNSPLWDLNQFIPASGSQWFKSAVPTDGFPSAGLDPTLFTGGTLTPGTTSYGSPSFPARSQINPLLGAPFNSSTRFGSTIMGFTGESQLGTATGRITQSKVFASLVTTAADGTVNIGAPVAVGGDPQTAKGKPSVVQLSSNGGLLFYAETSAGQSGITASRFVGNGFARPVPLNFGDGFSSVFSPSGSARLYLNSSPILELSFAGKLRGRPNAEVYLGRMNLANIGGALQIVDKPVNGKSIEDPTAGNPFVLLPTQFSERLLSEGGGTYRARGVAWSRAAGVALTQLVPGSTVRQPVLVPNSLKVERQSGLMVFDSRLGGKVYIDPELGTVKFVGGVPGPSADLRITYQPAFLRVTPGGAAAYSAVNGLFDSRFVSEYGSWRNANNSLATPDTQARNDRYFFAYGRGASGSGVTARPYSTTMRLGVRLPTRMATDANGNLAKPVIVTGNSMPYQVDPANGRIYFMAEDENKNVSIQYTGVDEATNQAVDEPLFNASVSFVLEKAETPIVVDEAANDSALTAFTDPFTYASNASADRRRPPLYWLFYVSTRGGQPDVYFQTIAPQYSPFSN